MKMLITFILVVVGYLPGTSMAAETIESENGKLSLFGEFQLLYLSTENRFLDIDESFDDEPPEVSGDESIDKVSELIDNGSLIGIEGELALDNDMTAFFLAEWEYTADEDSSGLNTTGDSYIGLEGNFGTVQIGSWDGIYQEEITDLLNPFDYEGTTEFLSVEDADDLLAYMSPGFGNLSFSIQTSLKGDGAGIDNDGDGKPDSVYPVATVIKYANEYAVVNFGFDDRALVSDSAGAQFGIAGAIQLQPFTLGVKYETVGESASNVDDGFEAVGIIGEFDYDFGVITLALQQITHDTEIRVFREDREEYVLNANFSLSEELYFYVETASYNKFKDRDDYTALGVYLNF